MSTLARYTYGSGVDGPAARRELGSDLHGMRYNPGPNAPGPWDHATARFLGSGRDALRFIIANGRARRGWQRLWVPGYYCQDVVRSLASTGIPLAAYGQDPFMMPRPLEAMDLRPGDAVLKVNYFGTVCCAPEDDATVPGVETIEDHTHDPWSPWARQSAADWCAVSLRKTLPVPDGGIAWSPAGHPLPEGPKVTPEHACAALRGLEAMLLKGLYLDGHEVDKATFRRLARDGEKGISAGEVSDIVRYSTMPGGLAPSR